MPRDMFGDVVEPIDQGGVSGVVYGARCRSWPTLSFSPRVIIIPLMAADVLPTPPTMMAFVGGAAAAAAPAAAAAGAGGRSRSRLRW